MNDVPHPTSTQVVLEAIVQVAPNADLITLDPEDDLRDHLELDSVDFLALVQRVAERTGREIPERDFPRLLSLASFAAYLDEGG